MLAGVLASLPACGVGYPTVPPPPPLEIEAAPVVDAPPASPEAPQARALLAPRPGIREDFTARLAGVTAGTASLRVHASPGDTRLITLELASADWLRALCVIKESVAVCFDPRSRRPRSAVYEAREGEGRQVLRQLFDDDRGQVFLDFRADDEAHAGVVDITGVIDPLSLVFRVRDLPLVPGLVIPYDVLIGARMRRVNACVIGPEDEGATWRIDVEVFDYRDAKGPSARNRALRRNAVAAADADPENAPERLSAWVQPGVDREVVRVTVPTPLGTLTLDRDPDPSELVVDAPRRSPQRVMALARAD